MTLHSKKSKMKKVLLLAFPIILLIGIVALPMLYLRDAELNGTDDDAVAEIEKINEKYTPWFQSLFQPPSDEIEGMLFALQSALGAGALGYGLGYLKGKSKQKEDE